MKKKKLQLLGKKIGMTQVFVESGKLLPVTVIEIKPCYVTQVKTIDKDGYNAVQFGTMPQKEHRMTKAVMGHLAKAGVGPVSQLAEYRTDEFPTEKLGDVLDVSTFAEGATVDVIGAVKGRGFQGVMKRFDFDGGPASHGSMFHRRGGSFGMRQTPGHIFKNKKMPGHMGTNNITVQNLLVVKILKDKNLILVAGSIPGCNGGLVFVRDAKKSKINK